MNEAYCNDYMQSLKLQPSGASQQKGQLGGQGEQAVLQCQSPGMPRNKSTITFNQQLGRKDDSQWGKTQE